jgi:hypothetical protein
MKKTESSIFFHCYDDYVIDAVGSVGNLVDLAHKNDTVNIMFWPEGSDIATISIKGTKLIDLLDDLCLKNHWDRSKFKFVTANCVQTSVWPHIEIRPWWNAFLPNIKQNNIILDKNIVKKFGCYIVASSWPRLWISAYLYQYHRKETDQTFWRDPSDPGHAINLDLDALCFKFASTKNFKHLDLRMICSFLENVPIVREGTDWDKSRHFSSVDEKKDAVSNTILGYYNGIFVDVVCESYFTGVGFRPTEKTARPLATKTPFIIMGWTNSLKNLKKIGFRTFSRYWNEDYDWLEGVPRMLAIKELIEIISKKSISELSEILKDMEDVLDHNQQLYFALTEKKLNNIFL